MHLVHIEVMLHFQKTLIENILEKLETRKLEIAYNILCNSRVMHILMNSVIYKPGKQRVKHLEYKFNKIKNNIKSNNE